MILMILFHIIAFYWFGTVTNHADELQNTIFEQEVPEITLKEFKQLNYSYCDTFNYEITDIYGHEGDTCSQDQIWLFLDDDLKAHGFEIVHSGRGNWSSGWRLVELKLKKDDCECSIFKKHWYPDFVARPRIVVTEQIICNHEGPINNFLDH